MTQVTFWSLSKKPGVTSDIGPFFVPDSHLGLAEYKSYQEIAKRRHRARQKQDRFRTTDVSGTTEVLGDVDMAMPGDGVFPFPASCVSGM